MVPVLTSFLPPTHTYFYLPTLFRLWEAFNSAVIDDRFLELCADLSEEHVSGTSGDGGFEGGASWKDVGIWSETEWNLLVGKGLGSMSMVSLSSLPYVTYKLPSDVPVGAMRVMKSLFMCLLILISIAGCFEYLSACRSPGQKRIQDQKEYQ